MEQGQERGEPPAEDSQTAPQDVRQCVENLVDAVAELRLEPAGAGGAPAGGAQRAAVVADVKSRLEHDESVFDDLTIEPEDEARAIGLIAGALDGAPPPGVLPKGPKPVKKQQLSAAAAGLGGPPPGVKPNRPKPKGNKKEPAPAGAGARPDAVERPIMVQSASVFPARDDLRGGVVFGGVPDVESDSDDALGPSGSDSDESVLGDGKRRRPEPSRRFPAAELQPKLSKPKAKPRAKVGKPRASPNLRGSGAAAGAPRKGGPAPAPAAPAPAAVEPRREPGPKLVVAKGKAEGAGKLARPEAVERPIIADASVFPSKRSLEASEVPFGSIPYYDDDTSTSSADSCGGARRKPVHDKSPKVSRIAVENRKAPPGRFPEL